MPKQASKSKQRLERLEEDKIIAGIKESRAEIRAGKGVLLRSLADLD